jgi:glutathione S-transferase
MPITFYYGSGSPPAWRVWLALEFKGLAYDFKLMSFDAGDLKRPEFLALNPRGRVPTIVDGDFALYEANAIVEYLEEQFPATPQLFPGNSRDRACVRRWISEIDDGYAGVAQTLGRTVFGTPKAQWDATKIAAARVAVLNELDVIGNLMQGDYLAGSRITAADFALYPQVAFLARLDMKDAELGLMAARPQRIRDWAACIEALPFFGKTIPPHWKPK